MPPISILIKPASSACNMACRYCFYRDVAGHREVDFAGMLSLDAMERLITEAFAYAEGICGFAFQGGEPTLAGLEFYREVVRLQKKHAPKGLRVQNAIQTNGYAVDEEWARFFSENRFLVGLSLDGPPDIHNANRVDRAGGDTFGAVMRARRLLDRHRADYNILCVVTGRSARHIEKIYNFFRREELRYLQFIPCLEPLEQPRGEAAYHLSAEAYGAYLITLFDLWYADMRRGRYISVRHIDNWLGMLLGRPPEVCSMAGRCSAQCVVEGDGGVYPCDFYVSDEWRLGTLGSQGLGEMLGGRTAVRFAEVSHPVPERCGDCPWFSLCRNGCRRDRWSVPGGDAPVNFYCEAYREFFARRLPELQGAARLVRAKRFG